ncbi:DUF859 domain-containing protein [Streptococcus suis]|nr:DUF859 domain-containing protein [Streptococcus suis]
MVEFRSSADSKGYSLKLWVDQVSQSESNNTSQVRLRLFLINTRTTFAQYTVNASVTADGQRIPYSGQPSVLAYNRTTSLIDRTITITHGSNGAKSFNVSATLSGSGGYSPNTISISNQTFTLTTIARSSALKVSDLVLGETATINVNRTNTSYTHTIRWQLGSQTGTVASNVATQTTWRPDYSLASQIPNSKTGTMTFFVDTYNGSTKLGTAQAKATVTVPDNIYTKPTLTTATLADANAKTQTMVRGNSFVQVFSDIVVHFGSASAKYGASIAGYSAEIVGRNQTTNENGGHLGPMAWNGSAIVRATVTDSRGITSNSVDIPITVLEYAPPALSFIARRGNQSESSKTIVVIRNAKISPLVVNGSQTNTFKLTFKVAESGTNNFVTDTGTAGTNSRYIHQYVNSEANLRGVYDNFKTYDVIGILEDNFTSTEFRTTVTTERGVWGEAETAFSFGKVPELREAVDSAWPYYYKNKPIQHHQLTTVDGAALDEQAVDFDRHERSGYFQKSASAPHNPSSQDGVLHVLGGDSHLVQMFIERDSPYRMWIRTRSGSLWNAWKHYLTKDDVSSVSTSWRYIGNSCYYKRTGDMVSLKYNFQTNGLSRFTIGHIPSELVPSEMMFMQTSWTLDQYPITIQVNTDGKIEFINTRRYSYRYAGQIAWVI